MGDVFAAIFTDLPIESLMVINANNDTIIVHTAAFLIRNPFGHIK